MTKTPQIAEKQVVVLALLHEIATDGEICVPISELSKRTPYSETDTRRALSQLVDAGAIQPGGRRGHTTIFRLSTTARAEDGGASRRDSFQSSAATSPPTDHQAQESAKFAKRLGTVEKWLGTAGYHFDREDEVQAEIERMLRDHLPVAEPEMNRLLALWRGHRPKGVRVEREAGDIEYLAESLLLLVIAFDPSL